MHGHVACEEDVSMDPSNKDKLKSGLNACGACAHVCLESESRYFWC